MKITDLIGEHTKVPPQNFPQANLQGAILLGPLQIKQGPVDVYQTDLANNIIQLTVHDKKKVLGYTIFIMMQNNPKLWMAKQAQSNVRGQNLLYNLILYIKKKMGINVLSDIEMSDAGEKTWKAMANNSSLGVKLYNLTQQKIYNLNDPNAIKPEIDDGKNGPVEWVYIIEQYVDPYIGESQYCKHVSPYYYEDLLIPDEL